MIDTALEIAYVLQLLGASVVAGPSSVINCKCADMLLIALLLLCYEGSKYSVNLYLQGTVLISLLQPAPETYDLFDDVSAFPQFCLLCKLMHNFLASLLSPELVLIQNRPNYSHNLPPIRQHIKASKQPCLSLFRSSDWISQVLLNDFA